MYVYVYIYIVTHIHVYTYTCIHIFVYLCLYAYFYICIFIYVPIYIYIYVCAYLYINIYIYIRIHIHRYNIYICTYHPFSLNPSQLHSLHDIVGHSLCNLRWHWVSQQETKNGSKYFTNTQSTRGPSAFLSFSGEIFFFVGFPPGI